MAGTLDDVKARGHVIAGVNGGVFGFSMPDDKGVWKGLDVDTAKAIAAAVFGDANKGEPPKVQLFGILGRSALLGNSPGDAQMYEVDAEVPCGEKLIEIGIDEVVLEKDGEKRTVQVFSDKPGPPSGSGPPPGDGPPSENGQPPEDGPPPENGQPPGDDEKPD